MTIEIKFQAISLLPCAYNIGFSRSMTQVTIFFQDKIMVRINLRLHNQLKNLVDIDLLTYFPVGISQHLIEVYIRFEIIAYRSSTVIAFFVFFV